MEQRSDVAKRSLGKRLGCAALILIVSIVFFGMALGPINTGHGASYSATMQLSRVIALALYAFAQENHGAYPDGNSSTEVFQKLMDGGYINDPSILFLPFRGKMQAKAGTRLKPENVAWDVTGGVDAASSEGVPVVFVTGFRVTYAPGGSTMPLSNAPEWVGARGAVGGANGLAVAWKSTAARYVFGRLDQPSVAPYQIAPDFQPDGHIYRQLTPDGVLK